nr:TonB-dependent receptor [uncultured Capnocytophaga sp.]
MIQRLLLCLLVLISFAPTDSYGQTKTKRIITGTVSDENGPLPDVSVVIKGRTTKGVATDLDGNYSIEVSSGKDVLVFSYVGYKAQEIQVGKLGVVDVKLKSDNEQLEEVVVTAGGGSQKKVSVTGSITSIKGGDVKMPTSSLTTSLAGQLSGLISITGSGEPGSVSNFYIRGISSFGGRATPLIILDDIEISIYDLNNIPAETIESFSLLKDASATAVYGSRGANGVLLIKTKDGRHNEKTRIGVTYEQSFNTPVNFPDFVDGATWMELYNEALLTRNPQGSTKYTQEMIDNTRNHVNEYVYPDVDWKKVLFRDMAINHRANLNVQGGGDRTTYYMSIQANHDEGLLKTKKLYSFDNTVSHWAYNFQNNITYKLTPSTKIELRMNSQIRYNTGGNYNANDFYFRMLSQNPVNFPVTFPAQPGDTHIRYGSSIITGASYKENMYAYMQSSFREIRENTINTSLKVNQEFDFITKGLTGSLLINFKNWSRNYYSRTITPYTYMVKPGTYDAATGAYELEPLQRGTEYISESAIAKEGNETFFMQGNLNYSRKVGEHRFDAMALYTQREFKDGVLPHRNQGYSGRINYNYASKYLIEGNFGYTGTERLKKGSRFEFFPAVSVGWVASEEKFFEPVKNVVNFFKVRASYGLIGDDETGSTANPAAAHFLYLQQMEFEPNQGYQFTTGELMNITKKGPRVKAYAVENATWEKVKKFNIGADFNLFDVAFTADYFYDKRYDILLRRSAFPDQLGYGDAIPWASKGKVDNWGFEFSANYNKKVNDNLHLSLKGNFTYSQNKYVDIDDLYYKYPWQIRTGRPIYHRVGYIAEGLFKSQEEIDNSPQQNLGSKPMPGDIKYRDLNGDGVIDSNDQTMISEYGEVPRIQYGFGFTITYKKFDFGAFFNGAAKRNIMTGLTAPFGRNDNHVFQHIANTRWTEANPDPNAAYPRLGLQTGDIANNDQNSTYWLRDGDFLRFKQLSVGYTFKNGRVYVAGNNLAVFSKFKQWDPELAWYKYPLQRIYSLGVQLNF